jgi:uncharacterized integral membrane protein (TIGR00698 family)
MKSEIGMDQPHQASEVTDKWWLREDYLAIVLAALLLVLSSTGVWGHQFWQRQISNPLKDWIAKPQTWVGSPEGVFDLGSLAFTLLLLWLMFGTALRLGGVSWVNFSRGFLGVFLGAWLSLIISSQQTVKYYGLEYALWAIVLGLLVSNTWGTPQWLRPALRTELYIKTGLILMGGKLLLGTLMKLGPPGLMVAWVVTPIVLIVTYWFGQRILKIPSKSLNMVISADMSVCGVSAAIATAAACKAKKEELSLAIGISIIFTVIMMVVLPQVVRAMGIGELVGGAWIGGTIDSTAAVVAAGKMIGPQAEDAAATIKMIQSLLIGFVAFGVAVFWVTFVDRQQDVRPDTGEIWRRFPKFILGFLAASAIFTAVSQYVPEGPAWVNAIIGDGTERIRDWLFVLAFVSIGLESDFRILGRFLAGGKPVILYLCGQSLNLCLTLLMAWLMFG